MHSAQSPSKTEEHLWKTTTLHCKKSGTHHILALGHKMLILQSIRIKMAIQLRSSFSYTFSSSAKSGWNNVERLAEPCLEILASMEKFVTNSCAWLCKDAKNGINKTVTAGRGFKGHIIACFKSWQTWGGGGHFVSCFSLRDFFFF